MRKITNFPLLNNISSNAFVQCPVPQLPLITSVSEALKAQISEHPCPRRTPRTRKRT